MCTFQDLYKLQDAILHNSVLQGDHLKPSEFISKLALAPGISTSSPPYLLLPQVSSSHSSYLSRTHAPSSSVFGFH